MVFQPDENSLVSSESTEIAVLPALTVTPVHRSHSPVLMTSVEGHNPDDVVFSYRDFSVVVNTKKELRVYDADANPVSEFARISDPTVVVNWPAIAVATEKDFICRRGFKQHGPKGLTLDPDDFPAHMRHIVEDSAKGGSNHEKSMKRMQPRKFPVNPSTVTTVADEGFLLMTSDDGNEFVAYETSDRGAHLSPRNWRRIDSSSLDALPATLEPYVEERLTNDNSYRHLSVNGKYAARIDDVGITVYQNNDLKRPVYQDNVQQIGRNVIVDPLNKSVMYYARGKNADTVYRLDTAGKPEEWRAQILPMPACKGVLRSMTLDPSGNLLVMNDEDGARIHAVDTMEEVKRFPRSTHRYVSFDREGNLRYVDDESRLVVGRTNLREIVPVIQGRRAQALFSDIDIDDLFRTQTRGASETQGVFEHDEDLSRYDTQRGEYAQAFAKRIDSALSVADLSAVVVGLGNLRVRLEGHGLTRKAVTHITQPIRDSLERKQQELASKRLREVTAEIRERIDDEVLTMTELIDVRQMLDDASAIERMAEVSVRDEFSGVTMKFHRMAKELFAGEGKEIEAEVQTVVEQQRNMLAGMDSRAQFEDWREETLPGVKRMLSQYVHTCPPECAGTFNIISCARNAVIQLAAEYERKFADEIEAIREEAVNRTSRISTVIEAEIDSFIESIRSRGFKNRDEVEQELERNRTLVQIQDEIAELASRDSGVSQELERRLKVSVVNFKYEIERRQGAVTARDGRELAVFGAVTMPKFEARVEKRGKRKVDIVFLPEERSKGPRVSAGETMGNVGVRITASSGDKTVRRAWEGTEHDNEHTYGIRSYHGKRVRPAYLSADEFAAVRDARSRWQRGDARAEIAAAREEMKRCYERRREARATWSAGEHDPSESFPADQEWAAEYRALLEKYADALAEKQVVLMSRLDEIELEPEQEFDSGKRFVPSWQSHWVVAPEDEAKMEEIVSKLKLQIKDEKNLLAEGMLLIKGHSGTGKDVLMKIIAHRTRRPLFSFDCTKWTTEFDLCEDVILVAEGGASQTVRVPSAILNGIQTPGAIVYLNEFNAMPEHAQIFLHSLFDEKRSMTLKTQSGRVIKADPSVIFAGSMNPNYPGTFDPQTATLTRIVPVEVGYPSLRRPKDKDDRKAEDPYSASEALKIARNVHTFMDSTLEQDMARNEFVRYWDFHVNGIGDDPKLSQEQKFDMDTVFALVVFANKLRDEFMKKISKSRDARTALPLKQPVTLREMRRCGYFLSAMSLEEKLKTTPEDAARSLIADLFLQHIDAIDEREQVATAMSSWTTKKRL